MESFRFAPVVVDFDAFQSQSFDNCWLATYVRTYFIKYVRYADYTFSAFSLLRKLFIAFPNYSPYSYSDDAFIRYVIRYPFTLRLSREVRIRFYLCFITYMESLHLSDSDYQFISDIPLYTYAKFSCCYI